MNTFHSNGAPIGMAVRIPRWKITMIVAATVVGQPPCAKNSTTGTHISTKVLTWAKIRDKRPGRRSSGNFSKNIRLMNRGRNSGLLDIIVDITNGKCLFSFEAAAPIQITRNTSLAATIESTPPNRNVTVSVA